MKKNFFDFINLNVGAEDMDKVLGEVRTNISFRNANLWILVCAILIACIGLNVNSTAVIIGAMLISPLMGPIVGAGFALGTYDFELLKKALKNLFIAAIASLTVATLYFTLSPFKETQSELLARTSPNIYDVLISIFGGLAGAISLTRTNKGNPIPGVAIATALMPPLCTAGYGLAIGNYSYFLGAFYLFSINSFFICIVTFAIIKYLKYPSVKMVDEQQNKKIRYSITFITIILIVPSFYLAYDLYVKKDYSQKVETFIEKEFIAKDYIVVHKKIVYNARPKRIELALLTKNFTPQEIKTLNEKLYEYNVDNTRLLIHQDERNLKEEIMNEIGYKQKSTTSDKIKIQALQKELAHFSFKDVNLSKEIKVLFPALTDISIGRQIRNSESDNSKTFIVVLYKTTQKLAETDKAKLKSWLQLKLNTKDVEVLRLPTQ